MSNQFYPAYRTRPDGSTEVAEIQADSLEDAFDKALGWWHDAERILIPVPSETLEERLEKKIENAVFGLDNPDDAA